MDEINWFHSIPLDDGTVTPGLDSSMDKLEQVCLPKDLSGKTVLDIGAWDGFFSFQAEKAGAERVLATDHFCCCLLYTSPSPRDKRQSRMPSSA